MNKKKKKVYYSNIFTPDQIAYYQDHWDEFVEDFIFVGRGYKLSHHHRQLITAVQNNKRVAAKSGKGCGKTFSVATLILTFLCLYPNPKVICTAPTFGTLKVALWPEVAKWLNISLMKDLFEHTSESLYLIESPKNWACYVRTAREKENIQGIHEDNLLIVIDEASGLKPDIFEALDTTLTGPNNKIVMIGNPTQITGPFYEAFTKFKNRWVNLTFNAEESPIVQQEQIDYYLEKYGKHHDLYLVNVKGEFPSGNPDSFMSLSAITACTYRYDDVVPFGDVEIGLDVARYGDDLTVLYWRWGYKVYPAKTLAKSSVPEAAQLAIDTVVEIRKTTGYDKKIRIKVDDSGVGCVTKNTQILTIDGWKYAYDINPGDKLYSKDCNGNVVIEEVIDNVKREETRIVKNRDGVEFSWSHLLPYKTRKQHNFKLSNWEDVLNKKYFIYDNDFKWSGTKEGLCFSKQSLEMPNGGYRKYDNSLDISAEYLAQFLGWYISEGCIANGGIRIIQVKQDHLNEIEGILSKIGKFKRKKNDYILYNKNLVKWIKQNCYTKDIYDCYHKKIPSIIKNSTPEIINIFLDSFRKGDGYIHHGRRCYVTSSEILSDDLLECIYKIGKYGSKYIKQKVGSTSNIYGRKITRTTDCWCIFEYSNNSISYCPKDKGVNEEYFDNVYYITITGDTRLFYTRFKENNYRAFWTHNGGVTDLLKLDREHNIEVIPINNGESGNDKYQNEASINWGNVRDQLAYIALPDCEYVDGVLRPSTALVDELAARKWRMSPSGKIMIVPKSEYKKESKSSPDRADALVLCFARKEAENVVLKNLDVLDKQTIKVVHYMGEEKYGAIFYGKDMTVSVVYTAWDGSRLYIYDEYVGSDSLVRVAANIIQHPELTRLIGNDRMFGVNTDSMENRFRQYKIRIHENYSYDEISSIDTLMNLTVQKRLIINPNCKKTIDQLSSWKIDKNRIEQEREYGLCYALSHIMFFLRRKFTQPVVPLVVSGYDKKGFQTVDDDKSWMRM